MAYLHRERQVWARRVLADGALSGCLRHHQRRYFGGFTSPSSSNSTSARRLISRRLHSKISLHRIRRSFRGLHTKQAAQDSLTVYECSQCSKSMHSLGSLHNHLATHHAAEAPLFSHPPLPEVLRRDEQSVKMGQCPDSKGGLARLPCGKCGKSFVTERALADHMTRHVTHKLRCEKCGLRFMHKASLEAHGVVHGRRTYHVCVTCNQEFSSRQSLRSHHAKHRTDHKSSLAPIELDTVDEVNSAFQCPREVVGNSLFHVTSSRVANEILAAKSVAAGKLSDRPHDGALTLASAPAAAYFSVATGDDSLPLVSFHPMYAEPGELVTSVHLDMNSFLPSTRKRAEQRLREAALREGEGSMPEQGDVEVEGSLGHSQDGVMPFSGEELLLKNRTSGRPRHEYRAFLVACVPTTHTKRAPLRVSVLLAREPDWSWCQEQGLVELDIFNNALLYATQVKQAPQQSADVCTEDKVTSEFVEYADHRHIEDVEYRWHAATRFHSQEHGWREVRVVVCVANGIKPADASHLSWSDASHIFTKGHDAFCPCCDRSFPHYEKLFAHLNHADKPSFECGFAECDRSFSTLAQRRIHERQHPNDRPFACTEDGCDRAYRSRYMLLQHVKNIHTDASDFICTTDNCGRAFKTQHRLNEHQRVHTEDRPFKCELCARGFKTGYERMWHTQRTHSDDRPWKCSHAECGKAFKSNSDMRRHERTHSAAPRYKCSFPTCDRTFHFKYERKSHESVHSDAREFACTFDSCGARFRHASVLRNHLRSHSDVRQFMCDVTGCERAFKTQSGLLNHKKIHDDSRPFVCSHPDCMASFRFRSDVRRHEITHREWFEDGDGISALPAGRPPTYSVVRM